MLISTLIKFDGIRRTLDSCGAFITGAVLAVVFAHAPAAAEPGPKRPQSTPIAPTRTVSVECPAAGDVSLVFDAESNALTYTDPIADNRRQLWRRPIAEWNGGRTKRWGAFDGEVDFAVSMLSPWTVNAQEFDQALLVEQDNGQVRLFCRYALVKEDDSEYGGYTGDAQNITFQQIATYEPVATIHQDFLECTANENWTAGERAGQAYQSCEGASCQASCQIQRVLKLEKRKN